MSTTETYYYIEAISEDDTREVWVEYSDFHTHKLEFISLKEAVAYFEEEIKPSEDYQYYKKFHIVQVEVKKIEVKRLECL